MKKRKSIGCVDVNPEGIVMSAVLVKPKDN
jgi:hypothetical protein